MTNALANVRVGRHEAADFLGISVYALEKMVAENGINPEPSSTAADGGRKHLRFTLKELREAKVKLLAAAKADAAAKAAAAAVAEPKVKTNGHAIASPQMVPAGEAARLQGCVLSMMKHQKAQGETLMTLLERTEKLQQTLDAVLEVLTNPVSIQTESVGGH